MVFLLSRRLLGACGLAAILLAGPAHAGAGDSASSAATASPAVQDSASRATPAGKVGSRKGHGAHKPGARGGAAPDGKSAGTDSSRAAAAAQSAATGQPVATDTSAASAALAAGAASDTTLPNGEPRTLKVIGMPDVLKLLRLKAAIIVDARAPDRFAEGHIPGAINCSVDDFPNAFPKVEPLLPKGARIVLYCDGGDCPMASELGYQLLPKGYTNLLYYKNGWDEWDAARAPREPAAAH